MKPRISDDFAKTPHRFPRLRSAGLFIVLVSLLWTADADASPPNTQETLRAGYTALQEGDFAHGLALLEQIPGDDPQVAYYRAYALEKLKRCREARASYLAVGTADPRMAEYAERALDGLAARCSLPAERIPDRGSGRTGWKIAGWTTMALGALTLLAVPAKASVEQGVAGQAEEYFRLRYGCDVAGAEIGGADCTEAELREDEGWKMYRDRTAAAARMNRALLIGGGAAVGLGLATVLAVAVTRPSTVAVMASPASGGAQVGLVVRF